jgi:hypothetical protein
MDGETLEALKRNGAVFLTAVGVCAALYAKSINYVKNVHWFRSWNSRGYMGTGSRGFRTIICNYGFIWKKSL